MISFVVSGVVNALDLIKITRAGGSGTPTS